MRTYLAAFCVAIAIFASTPAHAGANEHRVFPPDNCTNGSPFLGFTGVEGSNTFCNSGQDILTNALITNTTGGCGSGQVVTYDGSKFVCKASNANLPTCAANEFLSFDGTAYTCRGTGVPTCASNQVLTFNGASYTCVNRTDSIPTCTANQFLTYNGSYQCASVTTPSIPNCPAGYFVTGNGSSLYCAASTVAGLPACAAGEVLTTSGGQMVCTASAGTMADCTAEVRGANGGLTAIYHINKDGTIIQPTTFGFTIGLPPLIQTQTFATGYVESPLNLGPSANYGCVNGNWFTAPNASNLQGGDGGSSAGGGGSE